MIRGSMVALITPFNEDGSVNYKRLRELIDWHVDQQTDAILVLGTTAETPTLTVSESHGSLSNRQREGFRSSSAADPTTPWWRSNRV